MQGFNMGRYVPPELEGTVSFNQASGKVHALGTRARKLKSEGILTIRFELPFPIWCTTCKPEAIIGQGVRFNAEKKKVGNYHSTPIWSFRFKHTACDGWIEVRTDPKETQYVVTEGARKRDTGESRLAEGEIRIGVSEEEKERLEKEGGFGSLEKQAEDKRVAINEKGRLEELYKRSEKDWENPYERNRALRRPFRVERQKRKAAEERTLALQNKLSLGIELVEEDEADRLRATLIDYGDADGEQSVGQPLFSYQKEDTVLLTPLKDRGKRGKKLNSADMAAEKKATLQSVLSGRTKDAVDPFLDRYSQWTTPTKRRKAEPESNGSAKYERTGGNEAAESESNKSTNTLNTLLAGYNSD